MTYPPPQDKIHFMTTHHTHSEITKRLKRANGHLNKVISMIEKGTPCLDVAQQLHAVSQAINKAKEIYIRDHIEHCMGEAALSDSKSKKQHMGELKEITKYL